jgi:PAS domain S-box-containing protein
VNAREDRLRIVAAFSLPLVLVTLAGWLAWSDNWGHAEGELLRTADGAAEYSERIFQSALLAGRLTNSILAGASDEDIRRDEERYHSELATIMPELPASNTITVSNGEGALLLMSTVYPVPPVSVADREWVEALRSRDAPAIHVGALSFGRVGGRAFFSLSIPRNRSGAEAGEYAGLVNISLDPYAVARGLGGTTHEVADVLSIVRTDGAILSSTGSNWVDRPRVPESSPLRAAMTENSPRGMYEGQSIGLRQGLPIGRGLLIAYRQVGDLPVYATVSRPLRAIVAPWLETMARLLAVALPASLALGLFAVAEARRRSDLYDSEAELRAAFENATTGTALIDGEDHRILKANKRLSEISGRSASELIGVTLDGLLGPAETTTKPAVVDAASGARKIRRPDGGVRWVELGIAPVGRARRSAPALSIATLHDVTERKENQERQLLLAREVDHRAKNVLAIVQAVIRLVRDPAARQAMKDVEGRIQALARAHDLMSSDRWEGASLKALVREELAAYQGVGQISIEGPDAKIAPAAVQPLSMAFHELATNAVKHGALATTEGRLDVSWTESGPCGHFNIRWQEWPERVPQFRRDGSGLAILRGSIEQIGGSIELHWLESGFVCDLELPDTCLVASNGPSGAPAGGSDGETTQETVDVARKRVLLAEQDRPDRS